MAVKADLVGKVNGTLTVLKKHIENNNVNCAMWECLCKCTKTSIVSTSIFNRGLPYCKHCSPFKLDDLTGRQFGSLVVLERLQKEKIITSNVHNNTYWACRCDCGNSHTVRRAELISGLITRCHSCTVKERTNTLLTKAKLKHANLIGYSNNRLTIVEILQEKNKNGYLCLAKCDCGNKIKINPVFIRNGNTKSCGCLKIELLKQQAEKRRIDLTGQTFGFLSVMNYTGTVYKDNYYYNEYLCKCVCGKEIRVKSSYLKLGEVTSCGCKTAEKLSLSRGGTGIPYEIVSTTEFIRKHTKEYIAWRNACMVRDNYSCAISKLRGGNLVVHHLTALNTIIETYYINKENYNDFLPQLFDINNGITLSKQLHLDFHTIYGNGYNTPEQFNVFSCAY